MNELTPRIAIFVLILILHLVEEVKTGFRRQMLFGEMSQLMFVSLNVLIYLFCTVILVLSVSENQAATSLAWIFAIAMLLNGLGHIAAMIYRRGYFPGGVSAFFVLAGAIYLLEVLI